MGKGTEGRGIMTRKAVAVWRCRFCGHCTFCLDDDHPPLNCCTSQSRERVGVIPFVKDEDQP